ncbi:hypothetical protein V5799_010933, partial [Amblyomma americanum]
MNMDRISAQVREKTKKVKMSRKDLGIRKQLLLWNLLQKWTWISTIDSEEVGGGRGEEKAGPEATVKKSATNTSKRNARLPKDSETNLK